jgi:predicted regulator of Ras-like GTPase activity (Roadblock/LC7/MglB family)
MGLIGQPDRREAALAAEGSSGEARPRVGMTGAVAEVLTRILAQPGVSAALVLSADGLPIAMQANGQPPGDPEAWAAACAALTSLAARLSLALQRGELASAVFRAEHHWFLVRPLSIGFLAVVSSREVNTSDLDGALRELERAAPAFAGTPGK